MSFSVYSDIILSLYILQCSSFLFYENNNIVGPTVSACLLQGWGHAPRS